MNKPPLIAAILAFNIPEIESLIKSGENVNQSYDGYTPIQYTIKLRKAKIVKLLIEYNADIRIYDINNESPLEHIFTKFKESSALSIIKCLPDCHIADIYDRNTALHYAARRNYIRCIDYLISNGANLNALNRQGQSPIIFAAKSGAWQSIELLVSRGANVNLRDIVYKKHWSPVFYAISKSHFECVALLIKHGADVNLVDSAGLTPIFYAFHDTQLVSLLVYNGANLEVADKRGCTPVFHSVLTGRHEQVAILTKKGSNVDRVDDEGWTPLLYAIKRGDDRIVQLLLDCCNDVEYEVNNKYNALDLAKAIGSSRIRKLIVGQIEKKILMNGAGIKDMDEGVGLFL